MSGTKDHAHAHDESHEAHEGPIKTPKQLAWAVFFAFLIPIIVIVMLANYVSTETKPGAGSEALEAQAVATRIKPVASYDLKDLNNAATMKAGDAVYQAQCVACHGTGAAGAPKLGDAAAWAPRIKSGFDALLASALKGKGNMGPQGGGDFSDFEIARAVVHMANQSGAKFDEPKLAAPAASAPN